MVRRQCPVRTPLAVFFRILLGFFPVACCVWKGYEISFTQEYEQMSSRHRLKKNLFNEIDREIDIKGMAVAFAFLLSISLFAGGRDSGAVSQDRRSSSASMQIAQPLTIEKSEPFQHWNDEADRSEASRTFNVSR